MEDVWSRLGMLGQYTRREQAGEQLFSEPYTHGLGEPSLPNERQEPGRGGYESMEDSTMNAIMDQLPRKKLDALREKVLLTLFMLMLMAGLLLLVQPVEAW
jgi:hypothetical protein